MAGRAVAPTTSSAAGHAPLDGARNQRMQHLEPWQNGTGRARPL
jgi:hypothetical protein